MAAAHPAPPFDELTVYPVARRIRATSDGTAVVDTRRALLVWEPGRKVPAYALPVEDVAVGGGRTLQDPDLDDYVVLPWDAAEHWYEEDEEILIHPHDPFVRIETLRSSRRVRVEREGHLLGESDEPILLFETGLPTRYYLPPGDVDTSVLEESDHRTGCPYKGFASYRHVILGGNRHPNLFWFYPEPLREVAEIAGYLAPYNERVDLIVDGELQARPAGPLRAASRGGVPPR